MSQPTILVVEDSPTVRRNTVNVLEEAGYRVVTANDGEEAIAAAEAHQPDAVVLDIILPKKNGYQVCRQLKQNPCLLYTSPSPRDRQKSRMPSSA